jgi:uncharacterized protein (TIGR01370 family)
MRRRFKQSLAALLCLVGCTPTPRPPGDIKHWAVYYDDALPASAFKGMDLVIFDRRYHPKFESLKGKAHVLAYVSAGEVYDDVPERKILAKSKVLLGQNPRWKSHAVDLTSPEWREMVLDYVDDAVKRGFDGVMLDTLDSPLHWAETKAPERLDTMREAAASLVAGIRLRHPKVKIMVNRGFTVLPAIAPDIDYVLAESILTNTDVSTGQFSMFSPNTYHQAATQLHRVVALAPHLQVLTLDYWNQDDVNGLESIYAMQRASGFVPYVTTPDLKRYTPEPTSPRTRNLY